MLLAEGEGDVLSFLKSFLGGKNRGSLVTFPPLTTAREDINPLLVPTTLLEE
jgi:hypothetical protein